MGDDARQFDEITDDRGLCWVHEGRHYAKLTPMFEPFQKELESFQDRFWDYYRELRAYRANPTAEEARRLEKAFDDLFSTEVEYADLATAHLEDGGEEVGAAPGSHSPRAAVAQQRQRADGSPAQAQAGRELRPSHGGRFEGLGHDAVAGGHDQEARGQHIRVRQGPRDQARGGSEVGRHHQTASAGAGPRSILGIAIARRRRNGGPAHIILAALHACEAVMRPRAPAG